jgi:ERCC4-type nuclease
VIRVAGKSKARVLVDDRAGSKDLILKPCLRGIAELSRLNFGDVMIAGNGPKGSVAVGIEVKSIWDLVASAANGRLMDTQITGMLGDYSHCWLLVYGSWRTGRPANRNSLCEH